MTGARRAVNRVLNSDDVKSSRGPRYAKRMQMNCAEFSARVAPSVRPRCSHTREKERENESSNRGKPRDARNQRDGEERDREIVYQILEYLYPRMEVPTFSIGSSSSRGTCTELPCSNTVRRLISHQPALVSFQGRILDLPNIVQHAIPSREINFYWMEFVIRDTEVSLGTDYE